MCRCKNLNFLLVVATNSWTDIVCCSSLPLNGACYFAVYIDLRVKSKIARHRTEICTNNIHIHTHA